MHDAGMPEFEDWYRSEHTRLVTLVSVAVGDAEIGRDATDEALARAFERWDRVSAMASPSGWTYRVALSCRCCPTGSARRCCCGTSAS